MIGTSSDPDSINNSDLAQELQVDSLMSTLRDLQLRADENAGNRAVGTQKNTTHTNTQRHNKEKQVGLTL